MDQVFQLRTGWLAASIAAVFFEIFFPLVLALVVRRRLGIPWRYFLYGALIFFLFQLITRVPAVLVIQNLIQPQLQASRIFLFAWVVILSLTAGLFEEGGRYIGYRWLMGREDKTWSKALMYGLGHGGLESMLLVGGLSVVTLINLVVLSTMNLQTLPEQQRALVTQQLAQISGLPDWIPLVGAYERLLAITIQVALSVMVLQVFRRGNLSWLWLAILGHALVDFVPTGLSAMLQLPGMLSIFVPEGIVTVFGVIALWIIWKLRDRAPAGSIPVDTPQTPITER
jgi:uncharacterized membrane protein YhfC